MRRESLTPAERVLRARMAAYALHARHDPRETTRPARRAYFTRLAYLSARKRGTRSVVRPVGAPRERGRDEHCR